MVQEFLASIPANILTQVSTLDLNIESENCSKAVNDVLQETVLFGGKRLRPLLTYLMGDLFGAELNDLAPFAKAIECVHAASLAHDDVVDNANTRRGKPSINSVTSNQKAVLAGDYLLADVIYTLAHKGDLKIVQRMSQVISDLALGEWIQLDASKSRQYSKEVITEIAMKKTASVMGWCCWVSAYKAGVSEPVQDMAKLFGEKVGVAFQLMDDTLDFSKDSMKDELLDVQNGIINAVLFEWLVERPEVKEKFEAGEDIINLFDASTVQNACDNVQTRALDLLREAKELLNSIKEELNLDTDQAQKFDEARVPVENILHYLAKRKF